MERDGLLRAPRPRRGAAARRVRAVAARRHDGPAAEGARLVVADARQAGRGGARALRRRAPPRASAPPDARIRRISSGIDYRHAIAALPANARGTLRSPTWLPAIRSCSSGTSATAMRLWAYRASVEPAQQRGEVGDVGERSPSLVRRVPSVHRSTMPDRFFRSALHSPTGRNVSDQRGASASRWSHLPCQIAEYRFVPGLRSAVRAVQSRLRPALGARTVT